MQGMDVDNVAHELEFWALFFPTPPQFPALLLLLLHITSTDYPIDPLPSNSGDEGGNSKLGQHQASIHGAHDDALLKKTQH